MKIYISGKITGLDIKDAEAKFEAAENYVRELGYIPVNPMKLLPYAPELTWHDYMAEDIKHLLKCDAILMLPCWTDSKGAKLEYAIADHLDLQVFYREEGADFSNSEARS
jgi:hypothetical protein